MAVKQRFNLRFELFSALLTLFPLIQGGLEVLVGGFVTLTTFFSSPISADVVHCGSRSAFERRCWFRLGGHDWGLTVARHVP